jgi:prophage maintenance system killer protein
MATSGSHSPLLHTFLLVNGLDLELEPLAAYEFMIQSITRGEFRFGQILGWITKHTRSE